MDFFFNPRGIAVVGASPTPGKGGNIIVRNLLEGYTGRIYPVNPRYDAIEGLACHPSVDRVPDPVDLAIVFVGAARVPEVIAGCARRGIRGAMLQSAGFAETGSAGERLQAEVLEIARQGDVRLWGPNCMGLVDAGRRWVFSTVAETIWQAGLLAGQVSLVVQSGMLAGAFLIDIMTHGAVGVAKVCSIGNKIDVDESDLLEYLLADDATAAIGLYLESIVDGKRFLYLCRGASKPIVVLKGGQSAQGARAAVSHTASLAGDRAVVSGALRQAGVVVADDFNQMIDFCQALAMTTPDTPAGGNRVAVLTYSGGAGIVTCDHFETGGLTAASLSESTLERLAAVFPPWMPPDNPVDLWPAVIAHGAQQAYGEALQAVCADPGVDAVLAHWFVGGFGLEPDLADLAATARRAGKPLLGWISGEREAVLAFQRQAQSLGVPVFREVGRSVECLAAVLIPRRPASAPDPVIDAPASSGAAADALPADALPADAAGVLDEFRSKAVLRGIGVPTVEEYRVRTPGELDAALAALTFPVVMKGLEPGRAHKTEAGLVHLDVGSADQARTVFDDLQTAMASAGEVLVQRQLSGAPELIAGLTRDPQFGVAVMCGFGGVWAEVLRDVVFGVAPVTHADALAMIGRLNTQSLLDGFRGSVPVDRHALARILVALGELGQRTPRIREIDINPLIVVDGRPVAVDGTIVFHDSIH